MREIGVMFKGELVRGIQGGYKTQTRRLVSTKHLPFVENLVGNFLDGKWGQRPRPYGAPGDRIWVRETWGYNPDFPGNLHLACYRADPGHEYDGIQWKPSMHMPRAAARIFLEVTGVRVERLQDISEADATAEGARFTDWGLKASDGKISLDGGRTFHPTKPQPQPGWHIGEVTGPDQCMATARGAFANYINRMTGGKNWNLKPTNAWNENPWVWVIDFRRIDSGANA